MHSPFPPLPSPPLCSAYDFLHLFTFYPCIEYTTFHFLNFQPPSPSNAYRCVYCHPTHYRSCATLSCALSTRPISKPNRCLESHCSSQHLTIASPLSCTVLNSPNALQTITPLPLYRYAVHWPFIAFAPNHERDTTLHWLRLSVRCRNNAKHIACRFRTRSIPTRSIRLCRHQQHLVRSKVFGVWCPRNGVSIARSVLYSELESGVSAAPSAGDFRRPRPFMVRGNRVRGKIMLAIAITSTGSSKWF